MNEAGLRTEMVRTCHAMSAAGLSPGTSGNLSVRVPGGMLITPSAVPYDRLEPDGIVWMRLDGKAALGDARPSSEWRLHAAILGARPDAEAVLHAHPMFCTTLACLGREIPAFHYMVAAAGGRSIRCAPYATFGSTELADHALAALEGRRACLLANHGAVFLGSSAAAALELALEVETLAAQYWRTLQVGEPRLLSDAEMDEVEARFHDYRTAAPAAARTAAPPAAAREDAGPGPVVGPAAGLAGRAGVAEAGEVAEVAGSAGSVGAEGTTPPADRIASGALPAGAADDTGHRRPAVDWAEVGQRWIGRVGAVLLLLGLAYLMKFAADQGWLGPPLRIGFGVATGLALLGAGLRFQAARRTWALTLLGTGVATLYLTGYAAYALYGYLGPRSAFIALAATTALALVLARRREEPVLAQVGAAGAFATPLLLGEGGGATALSLYVIGVAGWAGALAFFHGWRSLYATILVGAFGLLALGTGEAAAGDRLALSLAGVWAWGMAALLPLARERVGPDRLPASRRPVPGFLRTFASTPALLDRRVVAAAVPLGTLAFVPLQASVWDLGRGGAAAVGLGAVAVLALLLAGSGDDGVRRARAAGAAPVLVVLLGAALLVPDAALRVALLAAGGAAAFLAPGIRGAPGTAEVGHLLFGMVAGWLAVQPSDASRPPGFATPLAAAELAAIAVAVWIALKGLDRKARGFYLFAAHLAVLVWVVASARDVRGGLAWVSVLWGAYGASLLVLAVTRGLGRVRIAALATLGLVAGKLLLVDTAGVGAAWRIVLFIGFGAAFLALGYISSPGASRSDTG